ncbi:hypothetical protein [Dactylosporangium sp. NPDC006015]|uniref:hypothetical protein n=1 Tax=Dactylosporangium sp. NPDC006015 TaxID=3154576 RepID=UPI0033BDE267
MIEDQVTAGAFAGRLLDDGLSPRAFGEGPPASAWAGSGDALRQLGLGSGAEVRVRDLVAVLEGRHAGTSARVLREPVFYQVRNTALAGTGHAFELDGVPAALIDDEAYWSNTGCAAGAS